LNTQNKPPQKKPLHGIFTAVPSRYDLINRIMTLGLDEHWRNKTAGKCLEGHPTRILDLCCGTGDLALRIAGKSRHKSIICGLDYSLPMLQVALKKAEDLKDGEQVSFIYGDVTNLPFPDNHFDSTGISFAFRNLTYKNPLSKRYLEEIVRVLKPGGKFVIVETSQPRNRLIRRFFHLYLRWFVFPMGYMISRNRGAYKYLTESAVRYYSSPEIEQLLTSAGFSKVTCFPLLFGATAIYVAKK